jgi:hypothetical protein
MYNLNGAVSAAKTVDVKVVQIRIAVRIRLIILFLIFFIKVPP